MQKLDLFRSVALLSEIQSDAIDAGREELAAAIQSAIDIIRPDIRAALGAHVDGDESERRPIDAARVPRPVDVWHEEFGDVLWWCWRDRRWLGNLPYVGSPCDRGQIVECSIRRMGGVSPEAQFFVGGWPGHHTHWTPLPKPPYAPDQSS